MATTAGIPNIVTFSICLARFCAPARTASTFSSSSAGSSGLPATILPTPPCILSARTVATTTAASGREPGRPALDVEELLGAHVGPEPGLRADDVVGRQREPVRDDRVVAVGDVGERPGVDEGRPALERLEQVRLDRVAQQDGHRPGDTEVLGGDRRPVGRASRARSARAGRAGREGRVASARTAITSDATVMTNSVSRGIPSSRPPSPMTTWRSARSLMSRTRGHRIAVRIDPERVLVVEAVVDEGARRGCGRHRSRGRRRSGGG